MAVDMDITNAEGLCDVELNGTVKRGDPIAYDGSAGWVQADASDATTHLYARLFALQGGVDGETIQACRHMEVYDADAPYTANGTLYLSATAGAVTHTRPTADGDVIQVLGFATSTYRAVFDIQPVKELEIFIKPDIFDTTGEPGLGVTDSPAWVGPSLDSNATAEDVHFTGRIPSNAISLSLGRVVYNSIGSTTGTVGYTIIVAADGATNTGDTGTSISAVAPTSIADNKICYTDITSAFDTDAFKAGYNFTVMAEAGATFANDLQVIGLLMRYLVV